MYEYPRDLGPTDPRALAGSRDGLALAAAAILLRRRLARVSPAAFVTYLAAIAPTLGLAQAGPQELADRYSYLATLGWSMLAGGLLVAGARGSGRGSRAPRDRLRPRDRDRGPDDVLARRAHALEPRPRGRAGERLRDEEPGGRCARRR